jgi:hypothetical protein
VVAGPNPNTWSPEAGYDWVTPGQTTLTDWRVTWKPGTPHPEHPNVGAGSEPITRKPGTPHPDHPNVVAGSAPNTWRPAPGYDWTTLNRNDWRVTWKPGTPHPEHPNVVADSAEGRWTRPGAHLGNPNPHAVAKAARKADPGPAAPSTGGNSALRDQNVRNYVESPIKSFPINPTKVPPLWVKPGGRVALVAMGNITRNGFHVQFDKQLAPENAARFIFGKETVPSGWKIDPYPDGYHIWRVEREGGLNAWEGSKDLDPEVRIELIATASRPAHELTPQEREAARQQVAIPGHTWGDLLDSEDGWYEIDSHFVWVGMDGPRYRLAEIYPMSTDENVNRSLRYYLEQGHTLSSAIVETDRFYFHLLKEAVIRFALEGGFGASGWSGPRRIPSNVPVRWPKMPAKVVGLLDDVARKKLWDLEPKLRGRLMEDHLAVTDYKDWWRIGKERGGTFELFDFQKGRDIVSLKTAKTSGKGWVSDMKAHLEKFKRRSITVNGEPANKILDLRINPGGSKEASESLLELIELGRKKGITVIISEF